MNPKDLIGRYPAYNFGNYMPIHRCGVSGGYVAVLTTKRRAVDGATAVFVYKDRVITMAVRIPYNYNNWSAVASKDYDTVGELKAALDEATGEPAASCWGA